MCNRQEISQGIGKTVLDSRVAPIWILDQTVAPRREQGTGSKSSIQLSLLAKWCYDTV